MLPQSPGVPPANSARELERCVKEYGLRRRQPESRILPAATGRRHRCPIGSWYPIYEKLVELDVPAMVHVSSVVQRQLPRDGRALHKCRHHGLHAVDTGRPVQGFPDAASDHSARRRGSALSLGSVSRPGAGHEAATPVRARHEERVFRHLRVPPAGHRPAAQGHRGGKYIVRLGDGRGCSRYRPDYWAYYDDTKRYIEAAALSADDRRKIYEGNARRVYPRLDAALKARGR